MKQVYLFAFSLVLGFNARSQSNPSPVVFTPQANVYSVNAWDSLSPAGTYPTGMMFHMAPYLDPGLDSAMTMDYTAAYNLNTQTRMMGKGADGFSFLNTGTARNGGYLGAAVLALNTSALNSGSLTVSYNVRTWLRNSRQYGLRLQGRTDSTSLWTDIQMNGQAVNYVCDSLNAFIPVSVTLPASFLGKPYVQIRWKYYSIPVAGVTGARASIGMDDISVTHSATSVQELGGVEVKLFPNPCSDYLKVNLDASSTYTIVVFNLQGQKVLTTTLPADQSLNVSGLPSGLYYLNIQDNQGKQFYNRFVKQ